MIHLGITYFQLVWFSKSLGQCFFLKFGKLMNHFLKKINLENILNFVFGV